jgi:hypothetical protein
MWLALRVAIERPSVLLVSMASLISCGLTSAAAEVRLRPDAPETYVVRSGDTLWGIAGRFLHDPWLWPEVWQGNPDVADPNRIYPGDRLVLDLSNAASPKVRYASAGMRVVKLSLRVRVTALDAAIPIGAVAPFLSRPPVHKANRGYLSSSPRESANPVDK